MNEVGFPTEKEMGQLQVIAKSAMKCGLYNSVGDEAKIFMILMAARELGIAPMAALNGGIFNIQGKIELSARLMNSMIRKAGHSIVSKECNAKICVLEGKRKDNGDTFTASFSVEDATKAGLMSRQNWKSYTEDMLYSRAMSRLARRLFPDVIGNCYVEGEIRDTTPEEITVIEPVIEPKVETPEDADALFEDFARNYHEEDPKYIKEYLSKYAAHWKKSAADTVQDYQDAEKFQVDFMKWKNKNYPTS